MKKNKVFYNIIFSIILQFVTILCSFIVPKLIIGSYGSSVNGLITSISQFLAFITLLEAGFGPVVKSSLYKPIVNSNKNEIEKLLKSSERIFKKISYFFILYVVILSIILPLRFASEYDNIFTISLIIIISISTFFEYYLGMVYKLYLQAEQRTYVIAIIQIITLILNTIIVCLLIYFKQSIQLVKLVSSLIFILRPIIQYLFVKKKYKINLKNVESDFEIEQKWDGLAQHIAYIAHNNADVVILTFCGNLALVSVYSVYSIIANTLRNIIQSFVGGLDAYFGIVIAKMDYKKLNNKFRIYECFYFIISTIVFSCALLLIVPFVKIYTKNITDINYIEPLFAIIIILSKFIQVIRQPYYDLVKVAGHFKETRKGAIIEALSNVIISILLVFKFGLVGVAIGTLVAMSIRTIEIAYYTHKYILNRSIINFIKLMILIIIEFLIIIFIYSIMPKIIINNYFDWIMEAIILFIISSIIIILINSLFYREELKIIINKIKQNRRNSYD